jgi:hypothetical protein
MAKDALDAHARDELGLDQRAQPKPIQAALASALAFSVGAALPTLTAFLAPQGAVVKAVLRGAGFPGRARRLGGRRPDGESGAESRLLGRAGQSVTAGIGALIGKAI